MPRIQVYLPDDLYAAVKSRGLPASELLQNAVREVFRREHLLEETDRYIAELTEEVGEPTAEQTARAEAFVAELLAETDAEAEPQAQAS